MPLEADLEGLKTTLMRSTQAQEVAEVLHNLIVDRRLVPGSLWSVGSLAAALGVSRTPTREALIDMASRGMVTFERNRGVRIRRSSRRDIEEIFALRQLLEVPSARRAVEVGDENLIPELRARLHAMGQAATLNDERGLWEHDRGFHRVLLLGAGNQLLADYVDTLRDRVLLRGLTTTGQYRSLTTIASEHEQILEGAEIGDPEATARAVERHLSNTLAVLLQRDKEVPGPLDTQMTT